MSKRQIPHIVWRKKLKKTKARFTLNRAFCCYRQFDSTNTKSYCLSDSPLHTLVVTSTLNCATMPLTCG